MLNVTAPLQAKKKHFQKGTFRLQRAEAKPKKVPNFGVIEPYEGDFEVVLPLQDHSPCGMP